MSFWNNPEYNSLKVLIVAGLVVLGAGFVYAHYVNPLGGRGLVIGYGTTYGTTVSVPSVTARTNLSGCLTSVGTSTTTGLPCAAGTMVTSITQTSAVLYGAITSTGGANADHRGFLYCPGGSVCFVGTGVRPAPFEAAEPGSFGVGEYSTNLTGLTCGTTYGYVAFAHNSAGTATEPIVTRAFTTLACGRTIPTVTTDSESTLSSSLTLSSVQFNGTVVSTGGVTVTNRGFTLDSTTYTELGSFSTGTFAHIVTSLACNTMHTYQAYATNSVGTGRGVTLTFVTNPCITLPLVTTTAATLVTQTTAVLNAVITSTSGANATSRSFQYGLSSSYGLNSISYGSFGAGSWSSPVITGLHCGMTYHFRGYAANLAGTGYGHDMTFSTLHC